MTELRFREYLTDPDEPARFDRMWDGIAAERARRGRPNGARTAAVVAAILVLVVCAWLTGRFTGHGGSLPQDRPLRMSDRTSLAAALEPGDARDLLLDDGSRVHLDEGARLRLLENRGAHVVFHLEAGEAVFDVRPGGRRIWTVECDLATVEVLGTRFRLRRSVDRLRVQVERGLVAVRGQLVPGVYRRLASGEALDVDARAATAVAARAVDPPRREPEEPGLEPPTPAAAPVAVRVTLTAPAPARHVGRGRSPVPRPEPSPVAVHQERESVPAWREAAARNDHDEAYRLVAASGWSVTVRQATTAEDLFVLADIARSSGHPADAVLPLDLVVRGHSRDPRAALAAFTLGQIHLDTLDRPDLAEIWFCRAIDLEPPAVLLEDTYLRLVETRVRRGDSPGASRGADEYLRRFPDGRHAERIRRLVTDE